MMSRTIRPQRGVLALLALACTFVVHFVPTEDPVRPIAGLLLAGPLLAWSIDRLVLARAERPPPTEVRCALATGFALVAVLAIGLVIASTGLDLHATPMALGLLLVVSTCDLATTPVSREPGTGHAVHLPVWGIACLGLGLWIAAFLIARDGAVSTSHRQATASANLVRRASGYLVMLDNATSQTQRFSVSISSRNSLPERRTLTLAAGAEQQLRAPRGDGQSGTRPFTMSAQVTSGPQRGLTLRVSAPAGP